MGRLQLHFILVLALIIGPAPLVYAKSNQDIRLVLQITVDGLRGDLLDRYREGFSEDGFRYLIENGTVYTNAQYTSIYLPVT